MCYNKYTYCVCAVTSVCMRSVQHAVSKLKLKKSAGPDNLTTEHLHYAGQPIIIWLTGILNLIIELELIPPSLKQGITIPVFKGGGKDPLNVNSYPKFSYIKDHGIINSEQSESSADGGRLSSSKSVCL